MGFRIAEAFVEVKADSTGLREQVDRDVKEAGRGQDIKVGLQVKDGALGGLMSNLAPFIMPAVASIGQLTGALALVPSVATAAGLAYGTVKVGVSGLSDAFKATTKVQDAAAAATAADARAKSGSKAAIEEAKAAHQALNQALDEQNQALSNLAPSARATVTAVTALGPAWTSVRLDVQQRLFSTLDGAVRNIGEVGLPVLRHGLDEMADSLSRVAHNILEWVGYDETLADFRTIMHNSADAVDRIAPSLKAVLTIITDITTVGSQFLPELASEFGTAAWRVQEFITNARDTGKLHEWIQTGIDAVKTLWGIFKDLFVIIKQVSEHQGPVNLLDVLKLVTGSIRWLVENMPDVIPIVEGILVVWRAWKLAQLALNAVTEANPWVLLVTAIAIAAYEIYTHWDQIKSFLDATWKWISDTVHAVWTSIKDFFVGIVSSITDFLVGRWNLAKDQATAVFTAIRDFFTGIWNFIHDITVTVWNAITDYLTRLWEAHKNLIMPYYIAIRDFLTGIWNSIKDTVTTIWNAISAFFTTIWNAIKGTVETVWNAIVAFLTPGFNAFRGTTETVWNAISGVFTAVWNVIKGTVETVWNGISSFLTGAFNSFKGFFSGVWNGIVGDFQNIWGRLTGIVQGIWNDVINAFKAGINAVIGLANRFVIDDIDAILKFFLIPTIPAIPMLASGGTVGGGFQTNGPMAIVGEGNPSHPEYVIPTDPAHRDNAIALYQSLGAKLMAGGGVLGAVESWISGGAGALNGIIDQLVSGMQAGVYRNIAAGLGHKMVGGVQALVDKAMQSFAAAFTGSPNLAGWIQTALGLTGTPQSWAGPLSVLIGRESGGNPNAINRTDSNAAAGHPSQGLMQTIPSTFNAYHQPGTSWNILDPVANIAAGINYIKARYGSIFNVQQANPNLPPRGYDSGGLLPTGFSTVYNGTGRPEAVFTSKQMDALTKGRGRGGVTVNVTQVASSPAETGRFVALALRTVG